jgi:hypothetical protein
MLMLRWGIALGAGWLLLALATPASAQVPIAGNGLTFAPIDTSKNLAAPIPLMPVQKKKSLLSRTYDSVKSLNPLASKPTPQIAPKAAPAQVPQSSAALQALSNIKVPNWPPKVTDVVTGTVK